MYKYVFADFQSSLTSCFINSINFPSNIDPTFTLQQKEENRWGTAR
jgi:hypothetical protein